ncbi:hypothetical protein D918_04645 [Trichuris suis]|nr:hypothetical protein D918_04645 [Trichuris suis]
MSATLCPMSNQRDCYFEQSLHEFVRSRWITSFASTDGERSELSFSIFSITAGVIKHTSVNLCDEPNWRKQPKDIKRFVHAAAEIANQSYNGQLVIYCHQSSSENVARAMVPFLRIFQSFPRSYVLRPFEELIDELKLFCSHLSGYPATSIPSNGENGSGIDHNRLAVDFVQEFLVFVVYPAKLKTGGRMLDVVIECISLAKDNVAVNIPSQQPQTVARRDREAVKTFFACYKPEITQTEEDDGIENWIDLDEM